MKFMRMIQADLDGRIDAQGRSRDTLWHRFEQSPTGWLLSFYLVSISFLPFLLLIYDLINGHRAAALYWHHIMVWLIAPLRWLFELFA